MKYLILLLTFVATQAFGQQIFHPKGKQHTKIKIQPGGSYHYYDDGGPQENYTGGTSSLITIYPSKPGQSVSITCNMFDINSDCRMYVFDGNHAGADILGYYQLRTVERKHQMKPGDVVTASSENKSGALTIRFTNARKRATKPGWDFSVSCTNSPGKAPYKTSQDCSGAIKVCSDKVITTKARGYHNQELPGPGFWNFNLNYGNDGENQSNWYKFEVASPGVIEFKIVPKQFTDFDWGLWGPYDAHECPAFTADKACRISSCDGDDHQITGISKSASDYYEDSYGDGFVKALTVKKGEHYVLMVDDWSGNSSSFDLIWKFSGGASLECKADKEPPPQPKKEDVVVEIEAVEEVDTVTTVDTVVTTIDLCANAMTLESELKDITKDEMGSIDVTVHGGTPPYSYQWKDSSGAKLSTMEDVFGVPGGKYDLVVTDKNGCQLLGNFTLTIETKFVEVDAEPELEATVDQEEAFVTVSYPGHFEYKIENKDHETVITGHSIDEELVDITKLPPGTYRVSLIHKKIRQYTEFEKH